MQVYILPRWLTTMGHSAESNPVLQAKVQSLDKHYGPEGQISFELDRVDLCALASNFTACGRVFHVHIAMNNVHVAMNRHACGRVSTYMYHVPRCVWPCIHMHVELCMYKKMYMHVTMYLCTCRHVSAYKWLWICIYLQEIRKTSVFPSHLLFFDNHLRFWCAM